MDARTGYTDSMTGREPVGRRTRSRRRLHAGLARSAAPPRLQFRRPGARHGAPVRPGFPAGRGLELVYVDEVVMDKAS